MSDNADRIPTARLDIVWPDLVEGVTVKSELELEDERNASATQQIVAFAAELIVAGERPWFEVHYPTPAGVSDVDSFDAVEVLADGTIKTLPPYAELLVAT